jgi:hypothetical protein
MLSIGIQDGQPALRSVVTTSDDGAPLTFAAIRNLPLRVLFDKAVRLLARYTLMHERYFPRGSHRPAATDDDFSRYLEDMDSGELPEELDATASAALNSSRKGRPVSDATLRRVAEIVKENKFDPRRQIHDEIGASPRTASRWIVEAKKRGYMTEED